MPDTKTSGLANLVIADADLLHAVDVSDTTMAPTGTNKKFTFATIWAWIVAKFDDTAHGNRAGGALHANVVAGGAAGFMSGTDKTKLNGIATGAEVNQNAFTTIAVSGQSDVVADGKTDTLTLAAGPNVTITTDAATDTVVIAATGGGGGGGISFSDPVNADLIPDGNGTRDLGDATHHFGEVHADALHLGGTQFTGGTLAEPGVDGVVTFDASQAPGSRTGFGAYGQGLTQVGRNPQVTDNVMTETIGVQLNNGTSALTTGVWAYLPVDFDCVIQAVELLANETGSVVIDIWKDTYANYPPVVADSITAAAKPTISSGLKAQDTTLTGWNLDLAAGDILAFNVDSATAIKFLTIKLKVKRT